MDYVHCRSFYNLLEYSYNFMVSKHRYSSCLVTTISAFTKLFLSLRHNQIRVQNHRYRKAVSSALWVQLILVICYFPYNIAVALSPQREMSFSTYSHLAVIFTGTTVHLNSSLNPLLYCWKIREVRQAVKETLTQLCC